MGDVKYYCEVCKSTMAGTSFYTSKNLVKYPNDGKLTKCKDCLTMFVDNWDPETFLPILKEIDVPYIEEEWKATLEKAVASGKKITGKSVLGRYLSKMKLTQWRKYGYEDTARLKAEREIKTVKAMELQGYEPEKIEKELEIINESSIDVPKPPEEIEEVDVLADPYEGLYEDDLTQDEVKMLKIKWGPFYKTIELIQLEKLYSEMQQSFDIITASHKDYLKLICKTSLKANQLIDIGDIDGYNKISKVYDALMKSSKFTAAQNKDEHGEAVDSVGELVAMAEKEGFIPRFYKDEPKDKVDETLEDLKRYSRRLITEEMNLGNLIESSLQKMMMEETKEELEELDESNSDEIEKEVLKDLDFEELYDADEQDAEEDSILFNKKEV